MNQIVAKVAPALAAGNAVILKPSEETPASAAIFAEVLEAAGVPAGLFNLVQGDGPTVGQALAEHPDVEMVSFTGSRRAGIMVAKAAAGTIKRVHQELGGKSANVLLPDADFATVVPKSVLGCMMNAGQVCAAPTRLIVPRDRFEEVAALAVAAAERVVVGPPDDPATTFGPLSNQAQFDRVTRTIEIAIAEGQPLLTGGAARPDGLAEGLYLRPTIFGPVARDAGIAQQEIFGPVLCIQTYADIDEAVAIANATPFGLAAYVQSADPVAARAVAGRLRAGYVTINFPGWSAAAPFGGYKQSGNGKQYGVWGFEEFLESKSIMAA